jgi:GNAT superfamily N-acetyltransferase
VFWLDDAVPVAAVVLTEWRPDHWACDLLFVPSHRRALLEEVMACARRRIESEVTGTVEMRIRDDDPDLAALVSDALFTPSGEEDASAWMSAERRPPVSPLASGYRLADRTKAPDSPHHMITRGGPHVADRLSETSLYRPDLDLRIDAPDAGTAAYALFWLDLTTGVGMVEPMRTETHHQRRGLARHLLTTGVERLAALGADRIKIAFELDNPASGPLYTSVGFEPESTCTLHTRTISEVDRAG